MPKLPLGMGVPPAASNLAILSRSETFALLFPLVLGCVAEREGSGEGEVALGFGEVEGEPPC
jgi:hypothetical protein